MNDLTEEDKLHLKILKLEERIISLELQLSDITETADNYLARALMAEKVIGDTLDQMWRTKYSVPQE